MVCPNEPYNWMVPAQAYTVNDAGKMRFDEPRQNSFADCWFVAALSSHLFHTPTMVNPNAPYSFEFYDRGRKLVPIDVGNYEVCHDQNNTICGAVSIDNAFWPAVYEKAYAKFKLGDPINMQDACNVERNVFDCLEEIHSGSSDTSLVTKKSKEEILQDIRDYSNYLGNSWWTEHPFVAATGTSLSQNHAYSILGLIAPNYIVLRNPNGTHDDPNVSLDWTFKDKLEYGTYKTIRLPTKGIFAYHIDNFKTNFYAYGYVL